MYHLFLEEPEGYRLVKAYKRWCSSAMMNYLTKIVWDCPSCRIWIVFAKPGQLNVGGTLGMPSTYVWDGYSWKSERMPVRPIVGKGK